MTSSRTKKKYFLYTKCLLHFVLSKVHNGSGRICNHPHHRRKCYNHTCNAGIYIYISQNKEPCTQDRDAADNLPQIYCGFSREGKNHKKVYFCGFFKGFSSAIKMILLYQHLLIYFIVESFCVTAGQSQNREEPPISLQGALALCLLLRSISCYIVDW